LAQLSNVRGQHPIYLHALLLKESLLSHWKQARDGKGRNRRNFIFKNQIAANVHHWMWVKRFSF
jgi:hypothetical protein